MLRRPSHPPVHPHGRFDSTQSDGNVYSSRGAGLAVALATVTLAGATPGEADLAVEPRGFGESRIGEEGVPPAIIQTGRDTLAAYFHTASSRNGPSD